MIKLGLLHLLIGVCLMFLGVSIIPLDLSKYRYIATAACLIHSLINITISDGLLIEEGGNK